MYSVVVYFVYNITISYVHSQFDLNAIFNNVQSSL